MGVFKLGKMTLGSMFKKPETIMYPIEKKPQPAGLKGHIEIDVTSCILCGMCDRSCSTDCITVDRKERTWSIDRLQCVQCGYCVTVCPKKCLWMDPNYAPATPEHAAETRNVPEQPKPEKKAKAQKEASAAEGAAAKSGAPAAASDDAKFDAALAAMPAARAEKVRKAMAELDGEKAAKVKAGVLMQAGRVGQGKSDSVASAEKTAGDAPASADEPAPAKKLAKLIEVPELDFPDVDAELEAKLAMMDDEKAAKVRALLSA